MGNGALYRGVLRETLEEVGLADKLDQYEVGLYIGLSVPFTV